MNQSVVFRWSPLRIASLRHSVPSDATDTDALGQWDMVAALLRVAETDATVSPRASELDLRRWVRRLRPSGAADRRFPVATSRKTMIKADLDRLRRELEAAFAGACETCVLAIAG
ncbi:MAG TPA: hypothetical protein VMV69_23455 [Pirellulales bacterium]|nr:hypothetical protein [Pirellulales bacterium]